MTSIVKNTKLISKQPSNKVREDIQLLEDSIKQAPNAFIGDSDLCPLKHSFCNGMYVREIFIPKGTLLTGKIHKHSHPNFLLKGTVNVITEGDGNQTLTGPLSIISSAGTKRALFAHTDLIWVTVHENPTNTQDLKELEQIIIAKDYAEYENHKRIKEGKFVSLWNIIINNLKIN